MLQSIRDHTQGWFAGIIISLLILSFALWGIHSYVGGNTTNPTVAKVNGTEITKQELNIAYERLRRQLQVQPGYDANQNTDLKTRALQTLINVYALKQASLNQNYRVSSNQIDSYLAGMPEFQQDGRFSPARFQQLLTISMMSPRDFFNLLQTSLLIDQPRLGVIFSSFALPYEVVNSYSLINQERNIQYAVLPFTTVAANEVIAVPPEQIQSYYNQHEDEYKTPEQVSIEYIQVSLNDLIAKQAIPEQKLKEFYNENSSSYQKPFPMVKDRIKQELTRQQAQEKFAEIKEKLASLTYEHPDSLEPAAKALNLPIKTSEVFSRAKGGKDISSATQIREAAFSNDVLALQNNSDVLQPTQDSILVLRVKTHLPAALQSLTAVEKQIAAKLKTEAINDKTSQLAEQIRNKLQAGGDDAILRSFNIAWINFGFIGRRSDKVNSAILDTAFGMPNPQANKRSFATVKLPNGYAIVAVAGVRDANKNLPQQQYQVFSEQNQNALGLLEYELYKQSVLNRAKIVVTQG